MDFINTLFSQMTSEERERADFMIDLAIALRRMRITLGLSQEEAAKKCGKTQAMISKYESGEYNPSIKALREYVVSLGGKIDVHISPTSAMDSAEGLMVGRSVVRSTGNPAFQTKTACFSQTERRTGQKHQNSQDEWRRPAV